MTSNGSLSDVELNPGCRVYERGHGCRLE
jgi:hypothetical protein